MLHDVARHMFYGPLGAQNFIVAFFFLKFGLRKGQCPVKLSQIR